MAGENNRRNTLDDIIREWARAEIQRMDIVNYNGAQMSYNHQADMANRLGLSDRQKLGVTPFPCPSNQTLNISSDAAADKPADSNKTNENDSQQVSAPQPQPQPQPTNQPSNQPASVFWKTIAAAALGAAVSAGSIGGTAWVLHSPREESTTQIDSDGRVGVDVIGWPENLTNQTSQQ